MKIIITFFILVMGAKEKQDFPSNFTQAEIYIEQSFTDIDSLIVSKNY